MARDERQRRYVNAPWRRKLRRLTKRVTRRGRQVRAMERKVRELEATDAT